MNNKISLQDNKKLNSLINKIRKAKNNDVAYNEYRTMMQFYHSLSKKYGFYTREYIINEIGEIVKV
ncbi:MAG: hypothetical protein ACXWFC_13010 [Nitrososphaeraceae archaeon]